MEISEVRVKLVNNPNDRLKAFCSITLEDDFVIRDIKIIDGTNGTFVAMPSRKLADRCNGCGHKNHLRARFCNECGKPLSDNRAARLRRSKLHADIAHPINSPCRERIQSVVVDAYREELERSAQPGYQPARFDDLEYDDYAADELDDSAASDATPETQPQPATAERNGRPYTNGDGYNDLIAELRRNSSDRRTDHRPRPHASPPPGPVPGSEPRHEEPQPRPVEVPPPRPTPTPAAAAPPPSLNPKPAVPTAASKQGNDDFGAGLF